MHNIYKGKKIFLTGHTGFKGAWLHTWLEMLGAEVFGYSLSAISEPSLYGILPKKQGIMNCISNTNALEQAVNDFRPDMVFHLAAQSLVRKSYFQPVLTYQTNVMGTLNVLEAARKCDSVKAFINVTTDKCYENKEQMHAYKEDDPLGGHDIYSSSKACAEILSSSYRLSFLENGFSLATVRAGNVIGGGDFAEDRLIPDCVRSIHSGKKIILRNPNAIRPWQHVLEPLYGYLILGKKLLEEGSKYAQAYNFGPEKADCINVLTVSQKVCETWQAGEIEVYKADNLHEAQLLLLDIEKVKKELNWKPKYHAEEAIKKTVEWYKAFYTGMNMDEFTKNQIRDYQSR